MESIKTQMHVYNSLPKLAGSPQGDLQRLWEEYYKTAKCST